MYLIEKKMISTKFTTLYPWKTLIIFLNGRFSLQLIGLQLLKKSVPTKNINRQISFLQKLCKLYI